MKRRAIAILAGAAMMAAGAGMAQDKKPLQVQETNFEGITAEVTEVTRKEGVLTVKTRFRNTGTKPSRIHVVGNWGDVDKFYAVSGSSKMLPLRDSQKIALMTPQDSGGGVTAEIKPGASFIFWAKYPAPPASAKKITYMTPHAAPFEDLPITEAQ
jgi:hypothetical protein